MEEESAILKLVDPSPPESLITDPAVSAWWVAAAASTVLALLVVIGWLLLRRSTSAASPASMREAAFREAVASLSGISAADSRSAAVQCSLVLRHYLARACGDPALFETHEEFISRSEALRDLNEDARAAATSGFERLVRLKYPPDPAPVPAEEVCAGCRQLLEILHRGFKP